MDLVLIAKDTGRVTWKVEEQLEVFFSSILNHNTDFNSATLYTDLEKLSKFNNYKDSTFPITVKPIPDELQEFHKELNLNTETKLKGFAYKIGMLKCITGPFVLIDCDTEFIKDLTFDQVDLNVGAMHVGEWPLDHERNLVNALKGCSFYDKLASYKMFNSGLVYIPEQDREKVVTRIIEVFKEVNALPESERYGDHLDEQLSISVAMQDQYGTAVQEWVRFVTHHWPKYAGT